MAMVTGQRGGLQGEVNVTPLIDVVLVLLIIFMVLTPLTQRAHDVGVAERANMESRASASSVQLVIEADGGVRVDGAVVVRSELASAIRRGLARCRVRQVIVESAGTVSYQAVTEVMDAARAAGADSIAVVAAAEGGEPREE